MDIAEILVTGGGVVLIGFTLWFFFGRREAESTPGANDKYACPMHPWITSNDPTATCSLCGMKLVERGVG